MARKYTVDLVRDNPTLLRDKLDDIAAEGGKIVSIMWLPERDVQQRDVHYLAEPGYTVVSEYDSP